MSPRSPRIIMYHSVTQVEHDPNRVCISPRLFDAQMRYLKRRNLRGVSVLDLNRATKAGTAKGLVGLTFDDGYEDFLQEAVPVLERYGFSATVFLIASMLGKENDWDHVHEPRVPLRLLGADGAREVLERGMEVGSHSMRHPRLAGLDPEQLEEEVKESRQTLGDVLGQAVEGFCYPYGNVDGPAVQAVRRAGYAYACSWKTRPEGNDFDLPRIPVDETEGLAKFVVKLEIYAHYARMVPGFRQRHVPDRPSAAALA
jgi:peptidoglycan/xylan/chitin deacetylase (PgdA/CDA1 family)